MSREAHVRFWEGMRVRFPRATHLFSHAWETGAEAKAALGRYFAFYNGTRPHEALAYRTPDELYFGAAAEVA